MMRTRTRRGACRRGNFVLSCCCFLKKIAAGQRRLRLRVLLFALTELYRV